MTNDTTGAEGGAVCASEAAVAAGYVVEPRVVGEPWRATPTTG